MTQTLEGQATPAEADVGANGAASLSDRVKGLRLQPETGGIKRGGSSWLPWSLCLLMAITWASFAIRAYSSGGWKALFGNSDASVSHDRAIPATSAKVDKLAAPEAAPGEVVLDIKGYMVAAHKIQVSPIEVSGRITKLLIEEGKPFRKGDILAEIDRTSYQADHDEAKGSLESSKAKLKELEESWPREIEQAKAQLDEAIALRDQYERDYKRFDDLRKHNGVVNDKEYEQSKYSFFSQTARVSQMRAGLRMIEGPRKQKIEAARAEVVQAQARFDRAKWRLDNCTIVAPVDGIILTKYAEVGNLVNALAMNANLNVGVCDMADLTDLEVDLEVQERDVKKVFVNQDCIITPEAYSKRHYPGRVDRIMPIANRARAIIRIRVKVRVARSEEGKFLKPEMAVNVSLYNRQAPPEGPEPRKPTIDE
jgi:multidrug resistance efflux pump